MTHLWWYLARASGMVAFALLTASVLWGIVLASDLFPRWRRAAWLLDLHRWLGGLTLSFVAVHLLALVADSQEHFDAVDILVPLASSWRPWAVSLGVLSLWALVAVQGTSLAMRHLPRSLWRWVHLSSYVLFLSVALHGALAGSDAGRPLYVATTLAATAAVMAATIYRILQRGDRRARRSSAPHRSVERTDGPVQVDSVPR